MPFSYVLWGAIAPFLVGIVLAAWGSRMGARGGARGGALGALLLAAGYLSMHVELNGFLRPGAVANWTAVPTWHWLCWLVPLAALVGATARTQRPALAFGQRFALLLALLTTMTHPFVLHGGWSPLAAFAGLSAYGLMLVLVWNGAERTARDTGPAFAFGLLALTGLAAAGSIGLNGTAKVAQLAGAFAAAAGGAAIVGLLVQWRGARPPIARSVAPVATVALGGLLMAATLYSNLGRDVAFLCAFPIAAAPALARLIPGRQVSANGPGPHPTAERRALRTEAVRLAILCLPLAAAVALAASRYEADPWG